MKPTVVAVVQLSSGPDKRRNIAKAVELIERAAAGQATFIALPELFTCLGDPQCIVEQAEPIPGPTSRMLGELAARLEVTLLAGSMAESSGPSGKVHNTSLLFGPDGRQLSAYRKIHLFDIDIPGKVSFRESDFMLAGKETRVTDTALGKLGQAICYDLRFPELFRNLTDQGAAMLAVPSAFTQTTGRDHWEVLLRARAIESQCYVFAPNQYGALTPKIHTHGRSMIVDPWGTVLATAPDGEGFAIAEIDPKRVQTIRKQLPSLQHRRLH